MRLRFAAQINPSKRDLRDIGGDTQVSFVPMEAVGEDGTLVLDDTRRLSDVSNGYTYFRDGDVVVAKITPCFENGKGAIASGLEGGIGFGTTELVVLRPRPNCSARFLYYVTSCYEFRKKAEGAMKGTGGQKRVPDDFFRDFAITLPSLAEQERICNFLDNQIFEINSLVDAKRGLLLKLHEYRVALISHTVTKGLNPQAGTKDSGLPLLGRIPIHWSVGGLTKHLDSLVDYRGSTPGKVADGIFLVTARNIRGGRIDYSASEEYVAPEEYDTIMRRGYPKIGDVLFTTEAPLGQVANVDRTDVALAQRVIKFRGKRGVLNNFYLKYWLSGTYMQSVLHQAATGSTAEGIKASKLSSLKVCVPPLQEQEGIVTYLDGEIEKILELSNHVQGHIEELGEYRAGLIQSAVTGAIDVQNYSAALSLQ